jgi:hypothetical protein
MLSCAILASACGGGDSFDLGLPGESRVVWSSGDQIHPALRGGELIWFDLSDDPNGACYAPATGEDYDDSCSGVIKWRDLSREDQRTLSGSLEGDTIPVFIEGLAAWYCRGFDGVAGLCVSDNRGAGGDFYPGVGWQNYYYYSPAQRPVLASGRAFWAEYEYDYVDYLYRYKIRSLDLQLRSVKDLVVLDQSYPTEMVATAERLVWVSQFWSDAGARYRLESIELVSDQRVLLLESVEPLFGLAALGDRLAFKRGTPNYGDDQGEGVHIYLRDPEGTLERADSLQALVSADTPVVIGEDLLVWLDYRDGDYQLAAKDLRSGQDRLLTGAPARINADFQPAVDGRRIVWADHRGGDWDLLLKEF